MTPEQIAEGRRLLDAATPGPWRVQRDATYDHMNGEVETYSVAAEDGFMDADDAADAELIVWARNNLPALLDRLDRWAVVIDAGANILENNAKILEHLVMDTPKDQELTDRIVYQTRHAAQSMRAALGGEQ
ncbi:hypothetical protein [Rhodococcus ruber]|uniref:hypothetical protein n=1 Tax=Rhodococcus ruber TaxID=1830 RepID=UPI001F39101C|nr:hypothetical protein [Rhodococcus ruber]MCF8784140.1 hypothetical protein [Rhodococcus ruber]